MTVEAITRKAGSYVCRPGTVYPFGFKVFSASDVYVVLAENGIEARAAYGTDYVVRLNDNQDNEPGGEVVLLCEAAGKSVTIGSCVPYTQEVVITNKGGFYPTILNKAYDKLTILVQQLLEEVSRCVKVPISGQEKPDALIQTLYESALTAKENAQLSVMKAEDAAASAESAAESADDAATSAAASAESAEEAYRWANMPENELVQTDDHVGYSAWHHAQKAKENADAAASAIMPGALVGQLFYGQIILSAVPLQSNGLCLLNGQQLQKGGHYDRFITHIAGLKKDHPDLFVTESAWWAIDKEFGSCGKFVLGEDSIRLPRVSDILQCTTDPNAVGDMVKAGLPNITGKLYGWLPSAGISPTYAEDSALYWPDARADNAMATVKRECNDSLSFDASRNNPLYGASDTVQPQTLKVLAYIVVDAVDVDALNTLLKTVNEEGEAGQVLVKGENGLEWANKGNYQDIILLTESKALTAADCGKAFLLGTATDAITITLPKASEAPDGAKLVFASGAGTYPGTIQAAEGDLITLKNDVADSIPFTPSCHYELVASKTQNAWVIVSQDNNKTWRNVSRKTGVVYTNETGRMINVMVVGNATGAAGSVQIERVGATGIYSRGMVSSVNVGMTAWLSIGPGEQYRYGSNAATNLIFSEQTI